MFVQLLKFWLHKQAISTEFISKNNYPYWLINETQKKPATAILNPDTGLEVKKNILISIITESIE